MQLPPNEYPHRDRGYSVDEIQKMIESGCQGRIREKALILLLTTAGGIRIGGVPKLKKGDLKEMRTSTGEKTYGIRVYSDSSEDYFTPCSPECASVLDKYFKERESDKEVLTGDSPVIRNLYNSLNVKNVKFLSMDGIKYIVKCIVKLSGVRNNFEFKGEVKLSRGFRKFYKGEADLSEMIPGIVELTQGHKIGTAGHYLTPNDPTILKEYEKVIECITIDPKHRLTKRVNELETVQAQRIAELEARLQQQSEKHSDQYEDIRRMHREMAEEQIEWRKFINARMKLVADARRGEPKAVEEWNRLVQEDKRKLQELESNSHL